MGVTDLPMKAIQEVISVMGQNYGGRLYKLFAVNAPGSIYFSWKAVSVLMDDVTVEKISISKGHSDKKLLSACHPSQI